MVDTNEPALKKARTNVGKNFVVQINFPKILKKVVGSIEAIVPNCHFTVVDETDFKGFRVSTYHKSKTVLIQAHIACKLLAYDADKVDTETHGHTFCLNMKILNSILKSITDDSILYIEQKEKDDDIVISATGNGSGARYNLSTQALDFENLPMNSFDYDYTIEFDKTKFKQLLGLCVEVDDAPLHIEVYENKDKRRFVFLQINQTSLKAIEAFECMQEDDVKRDGNGTVIRAGSGQSIDQDALEQMIDKHGLQRKYRGLFPSEMLLKTCSNKSIDDQRLFFNVSEDVPMLIKYDLGNASTIEVIIAPILEDEDL